MTGASNGVTFGTIIVRVNKMNAYQWQNPTSFSGLEFGCLLALYPGDTVDVVGTGIAGVRIIINTHR